MLLLPMQSANVSPEWEKIYTYVELSKANCPVLKSALLMPDDKITPDLIVDLKSYFSGDKVTVRYQYTSVNSNPVVTGNRYELSVDSLTRLKTSEALIWMLEPIKREKCDYGIVINLDKDICHVEVVGRGFDASDLTRGRCSPHEIIISEIPIRWGLYNEWWKFLKVSLFYDSYTISKARRIEKLNEMGYDVNDSIFDKQLVPISYELLEKLLVYISNILSYFSYEEIDFCVACSVYRGRFIFWDIQRPGDKMRRYGVF